MAKIHSVSITKAVLALLSVLFLEAIVSVESRPGLDFPGLELPVSTNLNFNKFADVVGGKRDFQVNIGRNGLELNAGMTDQEKMMVAAAVLGSLLALFCCCFCCIKLCCGNGGRQSQPTTNIIYQRMTSRPTQNSHRVPITPITTISAGQTQDYPPPLYSSLVAPVSKLATQFQKY